MGEHESFMATQLPRKILILTICHLPCKDALGFLPHSKSCFRRPLSCLICCLEHQRDYDFVTVSAFYSLLPYNVIKFKLLFSVTAWSGFERQFRNTYNPYEGLWVALLLFLIQSFYDVPVCSQDHAQAGFLIDLSDGVALKPHTYMHTAMPTLKSKGESLNAWELPPSSTYGVPESHWKGI